MSEFDIARCSKDFVDRDDAVEYMTSRGFAGFVLERGDGSITAVCPTYPDGFYPDARVVATVDAVEQDEPACC